MSGIQSENHTIFELIDCFERDLRSEQQLHVRSYLPSEDSPLYEEAASEILRIWLEWNWGIGQRDYLATILADFPEICSHPAILKSLLYEDRRLHRVYGVVLRREYYANILGNLLPELETPSFKESFPSDTSLSREGSSKKIHADTARTIEPITSPNSAARNIDTNRHFEPNDELGDFRLLQPLGHGAFSRVYLASQKSLANRVVVLKVTSLPMGESQKLARLQHSNIVPLYSTQNIDGFFILCMPFLGSITLRDAMLFAKKKKNEPSSQSNCSILAGKDLVLAIEADQQRLLSSNREVRNFLSFETATDKYLNRSLEKWKALDSIQTIVRIAIELVSGLEYAHGKNLLHGDIKPANILLGFDGSVMLLDFNLSRNQTLGTEKKSSAGGTLPYMAPEQLLGLMESQDRSSVTSDIYAIGVVLYELLTGKHPVDFSSLNHSAVELSLERHQQKTESPEFHNREVPHDLAAIIMKCLAKEPSQRYQSASQLREDLICQQSSLPLKHASNRSIRDLTAKFVRRNQTSLKLAASALLTVAAAIIAFLSLYFWITNSRTNIANATYESFKSLARNAEANLFFADGGSREKGKELGEQAIKCFSFSSNQQSRAHLVAYLPADKQADVQETTAYLSRIINQRPSQYLLDAESPESLSAIERITHLYFQRDLDSALELIQVEIAKSPNRFVCWFLQGQIYLELRRYQEARTAFAAAEAFAPTCAITWMAQGNCHYWMAQYDKALACYEKAEELEPNLASVWYNRGLVFEKMQNYKGAVQQFNKSLHEAPSSHRYAMALSRNLRALGQKAEADSVLKAIANETPIMPEDWIFRGLAKLPHSPSEALIDFEKAQTSDSMYFTAGQNRAHVLSEYLNRRADAIQVLTEMLQRDPDYAPALTGRAVLLARDEKRELALADLEQCQRLNPSPQIHYQMGCVYALLATGVDTKEMQDKAMAHLARALAPGYGGSQLATDPDLANLRNDKTFTTILNGVSSIQKVAH
jgi:eukaryotic-like serine/threonine-protein kinase